MIPIKEPREEISEAPKNPRLPYSAKGTAANNNINGMHLEMTSRSQETRNLKTGKVMAREVNILLKVFMDFICILVVGLPILILHLVGKPFIRGFNCDDESIMYPFKDSTITNNTLYCVGIFGPTIAILITESVRYHSRNRKNPPDRHIFLRWNIHPLIWQLYVKLGIFAFGACLSQMTTDIAKYSIGRLRPHFLKICDPNVDCSDPNNLNRYITDYECQNQSKLVRESRLSFLSGHSSFSAYTMVYLALYLQARMTFRGFTLLRPFLQALALYAAWYTALSRISDYKHHWSDVLAGSVQGTLVALLAVFFISDLFPRKKSDPNALNHNQESAEFNSYRVPERNKFDPEQTS